MIDFKSITTQPIDKNAILDLYNNVGWTNYTQNPQILLDGISASLCVFAAYNDDKLIGLIRVVGDGLTIIYIQDILVKTTYQHQGIGKQLLQMVLEKYQNVRQKVLMTDNNQTTELFYKNCGFQQMETLNLVGFVKLDNEK